MSKKLPSRKIQEQAQSSGSLSALEEKVFSLSSLSVGGSADQDVPFVTLKYYRESFECFSAWESDELKSFSGFVRSLRLRTWQQVLQTSGKGDSKTGLGYTPYKVSATKGGVKEHLLAVREAIGEDIPFFELRVTQKIRVHGFRMKAAFFLVLLDREHRVFAN